jgi:hypothetical protein
MNEREVGEFIGLAALIIFPIVFGALTTIILNGLMRL